ncbi:MAG TPA: helix-turn-helix domain-containing protein [Granulicella sp.]
MPLNSSNPVQELPLCSTLTDAEEALLREVISRVMEKWALWALSELAQHGPLRFSRLMERVEGVSQKSLTATLRHLERDGLITRTVTVQVPIRVDYDATPLGRAMVAEIHPLWHWAAVQRKSFAVARRSFDRRAQRSQSSAEERPAARSL